MLKNEVKKTTTRPPWPSARQIGPKWTTHSASVKLCIKELLECKKTANKPRPTTLCTLCARFDFSKQRRHCNSMIANASSEFFFFFNFLVLHVDKNKLWLLEHQKIHILYFKVCFVSAVCLLRLCVCMRHRGKETVKQGHKGVQIHTINIYRQLFKFVWYLVNIISVQLIHSDILLLNTCENLGCFFVSIFPAMPNHPWVGAILKNQLTSDI